MREDHVRVYRQPQLSWPRWVASCPLCGWHRTYDAHFAAVDDANWHATTYDPHNGKHR